MIEEDIGKHKNILRKLNIRLEAFVYLVPVPLAVYFTIVAGGLKEYRELRGAVIAMIFIGMSQFIPGIVWRIWLFRKLSKEFLDWKYNSPNDLVRGRKIKKDFLRFPYWEAGYAMIRWVVGLLLGHGVAILIIGYPLVQAHITIPFVYLIVCPITYVAYLYISQETLKEILKDSELRKVELEVQSISGWNTFARILGTTFAVASMPAVMFGFLLYESIIGKLTLSYPLFHISAILFFSLIPMVMTSFAVAKSIRSSLSEMKTTLQKLSSGDFDTDTAVISVDEFGEQSEHATNVIQRLKKLYEEIQELNQNLEQKVEQRTRELQETLTEVKTLKIQQDGDYFLTSLLVKPLGINHVDSNVVNIKQVLKQIKKFEFRGKHASIGGDLNMIHTIYLKEKKYIFFLNADAMGKSIQGAGGAIVLGVAVQGIIERTKEQFDVFPETWLKNSFIELHKIFEIFNGSMLVSLVMGLVEETTGLVYFINAEHPWMILYRKGKSSFIENELKLRKLGTTGMEGSISISTFSMENGDVLFAGSDGKDDIYFQKDGEVVLNEDENHILEIIDKAKGDISAIDETLERNYEVRDDYSLLAITFENNHAKVVTDRTHVDEKLKLAKTHAEKKEFSEALEQLKVVENEISAKPVIAKYLFKLQVRLGNLAEAAKLAEEYIHLAPNDSEFLNLASICYQRIGNKKRALELAERLKLREPENVKNLLHLVELYLANENLKKASSTLNTILNLDPKNKKAIAISKEVGILSEVS